MAFKSREIEPQVEAFRRARITMLTNQLRLAQEELDLEIVACMDDGLSLRRIASWVEVSYQTVANWRNRGLEARVRRSRHPLDPRR